MEDFDKQNEGIEFKNRVSMNGNFRYRDFYDCKFINCKFTGTVFEKCLFEDCTFIECDLSLIKPEYCSFVDVKFKNCKAIGVNWAEAATPFRIDFYSCIINMSSFFGINLTKIIMTECVAKEVDFTEANLTKGNFEKTDFENSRFLQTNLTQSNFRNSINYAIDPECNLLKKTIFSLPEALSFLSELDIILD
ncbi:MAG: pentapeptide repeat-containing protein [Desulforhopalus sp.]|nr:pentapeptide repeat-containing protein [Desulforhopalus sp.]